jgi:hypothetical protein
VRHGRYEQDDYGEKLDEEKPSYMNISGGLAV